MSTFEERGEEKDRLFTREGFRNAIKINKGETPTVDSILDHRGSKIQVGDVVTFIGSALVSGCEVRKLFPRNRARIVNPLTKNHTIANGVNLRKE